jgi:hypothetical protein
LTVTVSPTLRFRLRASCSSKETRGLPAASPFHHLTVPIANLRHVEWRNLGINFVMVFSPGTFRGAPHRCRRP